ncbi:hypothetical protein STCU_10123 [Strigomonas culicis]|uniref:EamA domain-containing protein n=1 Tax=Strigomonas culicis TaxID=28005 RepID=S9V5N5_9TRYP|nr:hypothetical protein STCU_10123 [Strigomonas culicis]|eukprot:EPY18200.1 hypothetical protein STCU_10123 [Strigomonas culicis]
MEHLLSVHQRQTAHDGHRNADPLHDLGDTRSDDADGGFFTVVSNTFANFKMRILRTPPLRLFFVLSLVLLLIGGNATQVVALNLWLKRYPPDGAPGTYTTFAVSGFLFSAFFLILLILHILFYRPDLRFTKERRGWLWLLLAGCLDTLNSVLAVYAAAHTPAILQALFTALVPIYAAIFTKLFLKDLRTYHNNWIRSSFSLIIAGVLIASISNFGGDDDDSAGSGAANHTGNDTYVWSASSGSSSCSSGSSGDSSSSGSSRTKDSALDQKLWALLFCLSVPVTVLLNVTQTLYMTRYTFDPEFLAYTAQLHVANEPARRIEAHYNLEGGAEVADHSGVEAQVETIQAQRHAGLSRSEPFQSDHYKHQPAANRTDAQQQQSVPSAAVDVGSAEAAARTPMSPVVAAAAAAHASFHYGNDTTVKLVMLTVETMLQSLITFALLPVDALPWFGTSTSVEAAWGNFMAGLDCLLHCPMNFICCCLYSSGFVLVYLAAAYLNQYSVTLCSMVSQLGGPITAILLLVFPVLNVTGDMAPWYWSALAIVAMIFGTFIYVLWDHQTEKEKIESELLLKMRMFNLCDEEEVREVEADVRHGRHHHRGSGGRSRNNITAAPAQPRNAVAEEEEA